MIFTFHRNGSLTIMWYLLLVNVNYELWNQQNWSFNVQYTITSAWYLLKYLMLQIASAKWKVSKYGVFSGPYFPAFWLNTEISVFSPNAGKYEPEKKSIFGHFSRSVVVNMNYNTTAFLQVLSRASRNCGNRKK